MAKLLALPEQSIIDGFKGTLDFYVYMGTPCARFWPRSPGHDRAPAVQERWPAFTFASQYWNNLSPEVQEAYKRMSAGTRLSGRDVFTKSYISSFIVRLE